MLRYELKLDPLSHLYKLRLTLSASEPELFFSMPAWTSGSYLIRDYAGRIRGPRSADGTMTQTAANRWRLSTEKVGQSVSVEWEVFAFSLGIHDAWLDEARGFFNPAAVFILPDNRQNDPVELVFADKWQTFSSLIRTAPSTYRACSTDELLDAPFTLLPPDTQASLLTLFVQGIEHRLLFTGAPQLNTQRLLADIQAIIDTTLSFWGSAPFKHYLFHVHCGPDLFGGLEHEASSVLQKEIGALPGVGETEMPDGYDDFLRLLAHEYFHAWLVKFLRPAALLPYSLNAPSHTPDLWVFEGLTSYYENLIPYRAGVISKETFFKRMNERFRAVREREGFWQESLSDAGFNAWIHLYKQTADSAYSQSSYYGKGAVLAFIIDQLLRSRTGKTSLDTVLRSWYEKALADPRARALAEKGFPDLLPDAELAAQIHRLAETADRPLWEKAWGDALCAAGLREEKPTLSASKGLAGLMLRSSGSKVLVRYARSDGPAFAAGLFADDEIVAIDGVRTAPDTVERQIGLASGKTAEIVFFRHDRLMTARLTVLSEPLCAPGDLAEDSLTESGRCWLSTASQSVRGREPEASGWLH